MSDPVAPRNTTMAVAASALRAQQARMRVIAENIANAESTAPVEGGDPYRRRVPVFETRAIDGASGVELARVREDLGDFRLDYEPGHPAADEDGYVRRPNVNSLIESMDMREAHRAYEANLNVIETARAMDQRILELLRK